MLQLRDPDRFFKLQLVKLPVSQDWRNVVLMSRRYSFSCATPEKITIAETIFSENTIRCLLYDGLMLDHRLRRWATIKP